MSSREIAEIIRQGEGLTIELKKADSGLPQSLFETVCAFLNKAGGTILLGVSDDKQISGLTKQQAEQYCKDISNLSNNPQKLFPSFLVDAQIVEIGGKRVVSVFVPVSSQVHRLNGKIYERQADGDYEVRADERIKQLYIRKSTVYSENTVYPYLYETDFVPEIVARVRAMIRRVRSNHPWNELSDADFFRTAGLYRKDIATRQEGFTMAALLLFGKDEVINSALPQYKTELLLRREDTDRYDDRETVRCNLIDAYGKIMSFVEKHLPDKFYLEGSTRVSLRERIFREVATNMLMHREYANGAPAYFTIYKNHVEAKNANRPRHFGEWQPGKHEPFPKNPNIANLFVQIGLAENLGTGIRNICKYSKIYSGGSSVSFWEDDSFKVIAPTSGGELNGELSGELNPARRKTLQYIAEHPGATAKLISQETGTPFSTTDKRIRALLKKNLVERRGGKKDGGYFLLKANSPTIGGELNGELSGELNPAQRKAETN